MALSRRKRREEVPENATPERYRFVTVRQDPLKAIVQRFALALLLVIAVTLITYFGRSGYTDAHNTGPLTFVDALYYSTVTITTTGYGDIVPFTQEARLITTVVVTPLRILFVVLLVGTTLEVLTNQSRFLYKLRNWQKGLQGHTVVCGFGIKGRSALEYLRQTGKCDVAVAIDKDEHALEAANAMGVTGIFGSAYDVEILEAAGVRAAKTVVVSLSTDEQSVLSILRARDLNPEATIVASCREEKNVELLKSSGADEVVVSSSSAGRILGMAAEAPAAARVVNDLLTFGEGLDIDERPIHAPEDLEVDEDDSDIVVAVVRGSHVLRRTDHRLGPLQPGDKVIYVRQNLHPPTPHHEQGEGDPIRSSEEERGER